MASITVVSLLPGLLERRMEELLARGFTGSVEIHINSGAIKGFKVVESVSIDAPTRQTT